MHIINTKFSFRNYFRFHFFNIKNSLLYKLNLINWIIYTILEKSISNVNGKISNLVKNGELVRLKKASPEVYSLGIDWIYDDIEGEKFITTTEKALCDKIKYDRGIGTLTQTSMIEYLKYDLRIDITTPLNHELIETLNVEKAKNDFQPFIKNIREIELWSKEFFIAVIENIKVK